MYTWIYLEYCPTLLYSTQGYLQNIDSLYTVQTDISRILSHSTVHTDISRILELTDAQGTGRGVEGGEGGGGRVTTASFPRGSAVFQLFVCHFLAAIECLKNPRMTFGRFVTVQDCPDESWIC